MPRAKTEKPDPKFEKSVLVRIPKRWHKFLRDKAHDEEGHISDLVRDALKQTYGLPCDCCPGDKG